MQGRSEPNRELLDAAALCRQLVPEGSVEVFLADHRQELFPDEMFADLFPSGRGRPSVPADVIAAVMVLQALEGLSDRDAARALKDRISWKVACGLALDDEGFHHTVLTYWRTRLRSSDRPERIFEAVRSVIESTGVLKARTRRALDSTMLDDAVATQDTVTQLISAIRRVRRDVPAAATVELTAHDYEAGVKPVIAWDDPVAKEGLVSALVGDALNLIQTLEGVELTADEQDAVGLLGLVAGQDVEPADTEGTWRIARRVAPDRIISTVDPEARHMHKSRSTYRDGYKAHLAVEPDTGIITACSLTPANAGDGPTGVALLEREEPGLEVLADSAYGSGEVRAALQKASHRPPPTCSPPQASHSTPASSTPSTSPGSWPPTSTAGRRPACWTRTTTNATSPGHVPCCTRKPRSRCGEATTRPPTHSGSSSRNCSSTNSHCAASEPSSPAPTSATRYPATTTTP